MSRKVVAAKKTRSSRPAAGAGALHKHEGILVLGMHRSGTSAITRVLNLLGVDLGGALMPAQAGVNDAGFWEHLEVVQMHERLLRWHNSTWFAIEGLPANAMHDGVGQQSVRDARTFLRDEFGKSPLWAIKDPRLCLFVPLWAEAMRAENVEAKFILAVRHPDEVAASLEKRDALTRGHSHLLWGRYLVESVKASAGKPRAVCDYAMLLRDWRGEVSRIARELSIEWPTPIAASAAKIEEFLTDDQRHHRAPEIAGPPDALTASVHEMYRIFQRLAAGEAQWQQLELAIAEFEKVSAAIVPHMQDLLRHVWIHADRAQQAEQQLVAVATHGKGGSIVSHDELYRETKAGMQEALGPFAGSVEKMLAELRAQLDDKDKDSERLRVLAQTQVEVCKAELLGRDMLMAQLQQVVAEKEARLVTAGQSLQRNDSGMAELRAHADALAELRLELEEGLQASDRQVAVLRTELAGRDAVINELHQTAAEKEARLVAAGQVVQERAAGMAELRAHAEALSTLRADLEQALQASGRQVAVLTTELAGRDAVITELHQVAAEKEARLVSAGQIVQERDAGMAELRAHADALSALRADLEQALQASERQVAVSRTELAGRDAVITELQQVAAEKEARLVSAGQILNERVAGLAELRAHADALSALRTDLEQALQASERQVAVLETELAGRKAVITELHQVAAEKEARLVSAGQLLQQRDAELIELRAYAGELTVIRTELEQGLQSSERQSEALQVELSAERRDWLVEAARHASLHKEAQGENTVLGRLIDEIHKDAEELRLQLASTEQAVNRILMSHSWRLTKPLRWMRKAMGGG